MKEGTWRGGRFPDHEDPCARAQLRPIGKPSPSQPTAGSTRSISAATASRLGERIPGMAGPMEAVVTATSRWGNRASITWSMAAVSRLRHDSPAGGAGRRARGRMVGVWQVLTETAYAERIGVLAVPWDRAEKGGCRSRDCDGTSPKLMGAGMRLLRHFPTSGRESYLRPDTLSRTRWTAGAAGAAP